MHVRVHLEDVGVERLTVAVEVRHELIFGRGERLRDPDVHDGRKSSKTGATGCTALMWVCSRWADCEAPVAIRRSTDSAPTGSTGASGRCGPTAWATWPNTPYEAFSLGRDLP